MNKKERAFVKLVWAHYKKHGRDLPWRHTREPYRILVSEVMLQQTQVLRVVPKYEEFLKLFPSVRALARAPLSSVLKVWSGLGYNRRAKMLHECAKEIVAHHNGRFPKNPDATTRFDLATTRSNLVKLPGVGPYTAGAVLAFAYNTPVPIIETNIRTVYLHHFFKGTEDVSDRDVLDVVERTLDHQNPRQWYYALMDYGAHLKLSEGNANKRSKHYTKQSKFKGSDREIRGALLKVLTTGAKTEAALRRLPHPPSRITDQLDALSAEGFVEKKRSKWQLAG